MSARAGERGFTLVEVLMAMMIVATTIAGLMYRVDASLSTAGDTNFLRIAKMLLRAKMGEVIAGVEAGTNGSFEDQGFPAYTWDVVVQPVQVSQDESALQVTVSVHHPTMGADEQQDANAGASGDLMSDGPTVVRATTLIDPPDAQLLPPGSGGASQPATTGAGGTAAPGAQP